MTQVDHNKLSQEDLELLARLSEKLRKHVCEKGLPSSTEEIRHHIKIFREIQSNAASRRDFEVLAECSSELHYWVTQVFYITGDMDFSDPVSLNELIPPEQEQGESPVAQWSFERFFDKILQHIIEPLVPEPSRAHACFEAPSYRPARRVFLAFESSLGKTAFEKYLQPQAPSISGQYRGQALKLWQFSLEDLGIPSNQEWQIKVTPAYVPSRASNVKQTTSVFQQAQSHTSVPMVYPSDILDNNPYTQNQPESVDKDTNNVLNCAILAHS